MDGVVDGEEDDTDEEILAVTDTSSVTVIELRIGEVLFVHDIDPAATIGATTKKHGPMAPGFLSPKTRLRYRCPVIG